MQNEVYITPSWDLNPLTSINGKASVVSPRTYQSLYPSGKVPRSSKDYGKIFICRRGCNTRTATYTDEFVWEDIYKRFEDLDALVERVQSQTKSTRKRKRDVSYEDAGIDVYLPLSPNCLKLPDADFLRTLKSKKRLRKLLASGKNLTMHQLRPPNRPNALSRNSKPQAINGLPPLL